MGSSKATEPDVEVVVVGAGLAGLYLLHRLGRSRSVIAFEEGDGVGGTWYWNRYPGARCDVESLQYSYSSSEDLQQEWSWSDRYPSQPEIERYLNHVADRFDLRRHIRFATRVAEASFDEVTSTWKVVTTRGEAVRARFCIMATGCLSAVNIPAIKGAERFAGRSFHTGRWPEEPISFKGRRVGVIGTGSSGIQVIPVIAKEAQQLYVFQRTANYSIPAWNGPLPDSVQAEWKRDYRGRREKARRTRSGVLYEYGQRATADASPEERRQEYERRWALGGANFLHAFNDVMVDEAANRLMADFVRGKIRGIVKDARLAEILCPTDHAIGTKRICIDSDYFQTFNRPNVTLVDLRKTPIEEITTTGIRIAASCHGLDDIVFATGYDAVTGALTRIEITGARGQALRDKWAAGARTYLGLMVAGFPNLFLITGPGSPSILANGVVSIEQHVEWVAQCLDRMEQSGLKQIEPTEGAEEGWVQQVAAVAGQTLFSRTKSWFSGANIPGKPEVFLPYVGGFDTYARICAEVADEGYSGFLLS